MSRFNDLAAHGGDLGQDMRRGAGTDPGRRRRAAGGLGKHLQGARELCDQHNALLVLRRSANRHGSYWRAVCLYALRRDPGHLTSAKSLGGGFPIAAMLTTEALAKHLVVGTHGTTYGGNPLACAVGNAVIDVINTPQVLQGVKAKHDLFKTVLSKSASNTACSPKCAAWACCWGVY